MNRFAIKDGLIQSDIEFANKKPLNADLSPYAGSNMTWNATTKKFDATGGGGSVPWVNVKLPPYNAAGDGVTDDTTAINQAMADVCAAGGGIVFFPRGTYLCNGAPDPLGYNSILSVPWSGNSVHLPGTPDSSVSLLLIGEVVPPWSVVDAFDSSKCATIKTTRTDAAPVALLAGNSFQGTGFISSYTVMNGTLLTIQNMSFEVPSNPTIHGLRLDGMGWTNLERVNVMAGGAEPTHGTFGILTSLSENWGVNYLDYVLVSGFDTGIQTSEHLRCRQALIVGCKVGVAFGASIYPSQAFLQIISCPDAIKFVGHHVVDLLLEIEHSPNADWTAAQHDILDASNNGAGLVKTFIGAGDSGSYIAPTISGGAGLTIHELTANRIRLATGNGAGLSVGAGFITGGGAVPPGGANNQVLRKTSGSDYAVGWVDGVLKQTSYPTPTNNAEVVACLRAAGLCI